MDPYDLVPDAIRDALASNLPEDTKAALVMRLMAVRDGLCGNPDCRDLCKVSCAPPLPRPKTR